VFIISKDKVDLGGRLRNKLCKGWEAEGDASMEPEDGDRLFASP
jgi:hypothetical protein